MCMPVVFEFLPENIRTNTLRIYSRTLLHVTFYTANTTLYAIYCARAYSRVTLDGEGDLITKRVNGEDSIWRFHTLHKNNKLTYDAAFSCHCCASERVLKMRANMCLERNKDSVSAADIHASRRAANEPYVDYIFSTSISSACAKRNVGIIDSSSKVQNRKLDSSRRANRRKHTKRMASAASIPGFLEMDSSNLAFKSGYEPGQRYQRRHFLAFSFQLK